MKNKKLIAVVAAICVVILIGAVAISKIVNKTTHAEVSNELTFDTNPMDQDAPEASENAENSTKEVEIYTSYVDKEDNSERNEQKDGNLKNTETDKAPNSNTNSNTASNSDSTSASNNQSNTEAGSDNDYYPNIPENQLNTDPEPEDDIVIFPYAIPNTSLTILSIASYDGIYLEDGSDSAVSGIYSIVIENTGSMDVEFARISLSCDGMPITFELSDLPSGATVVAQESRQTTYQDGVYQDCTADMAEIDVLEQSREQVLVQENEDGSLTVLNLTDRLIPCVRVFYKFYMSEEDVYVGGITYTAKLTDLEAGGSQTIIPSHYSLGYSKVVMVRTYDTKE